MLNEQPYYTVMHRCPDGAGFYEDRTQPFHCGGYPARRWGEERVAVAFAAADANGNPWGYSLRVYLNYPQCSRTRVVHETSPLPLPDRAGGEEGADLLAGQTRRLAAWFEAMVSRGGLTLPTSLSPGEGHGPWLRGQFGLYHDPSCYDEAAWAAIAAQLFPPAA